ncbi:MAG TPA: ABC transporter substrate-binding protein [Candidatus Limnocylindrales bacterium]|nr:ABC transporter substrate-binding protein [Candidatus Limnocylindrales bacterium]
MTNRKWSLPALVTSLALVVAACGGATPSASTAAPTAAPATEAPATEAPATEAPAFTGMAYPESGEAPCGQAAAPDATHSAYTGQFKKITAIDARTVEFQLCYPDVAFLAKIAFSAFGIDDADFLAAHAPDKSYLDQPNGTGPYKLTEWSKGNRLVLGANETYWGTAPQSANVEFRWSDQAAQRWLELQSGTVDGIDNPGTDDIPNIKTDSSVTFYPREGLNTFYLGFNNTLKPWSNEKIRQAIQLGINRQQIVDNFYPEGSEVATHFTPCSIPFGCEGDATWDFNLAEAKRLLAEGMAEEGITSIDTKLQFREAVRGYLPDPPQIATEISGQLKTNLGINAALDLQESGAFLDANAAGTLEGIFLLGWGADYPDPTNFLDYHFGSGSGAKFGAPFDDIVAALNKGAQTADNAVRQAAYGEANGLIKQHVPAVIIAHGGSGTVFKADVTGAHSSPLSNEVFSVMKAGDRDTVVWMQNAEPLSLYCGDETDGETLRACEQIKESLYSYKIGGTDTEPGLAESCEPNAELTTWTCTLREGVTFHDGATLDANDVVVSYAVQWDTEHPLHIGRSGAFEYFPGLFGGFLNPPAATP